MTDILERLRKYSKYDETVHEAADEIERLRAALQSILVTSAAPHAHLIARAALANAHAVRTSEKPEHETSKLERDDK